MKKLILVIALLLVTAGCSSNSDEKILGEATVTAVNAKNVMNLFVVLGEAVADGRANPDPDLDLEEHSAAMQEGANEAVFVVIDEDGKAVVSGINAANWRGDESAAETEEKIKIHIEANVYVDDDGEIKRLLDSGAYIFILNDNKCTHTAFIPDYTDEIDLTRFVENSVLTNIVDGRVQENSEIIIGTFP
jgi:hypothetical protein